MRGGDTIPVHEMVTTLRLIADLLEKTETIGKITLPDILEDLRRDVEKVFEKYEKELGNGPDKVDDFTILNDTEEHGST
jgi:hypothetical protein